MFLSQKFCLQMVLVPLPSQATSREIYGACLLCVCLSSLDLGQLFLELDLVIRLTSTGISPQDVKADALARLVHLSAKRRESPRAQSVNVCEGWKSQYFGIFGRWNWCSICGMFFCLLPKNMCGYLMGREDFVWNICWCGFTLVKPQEVVESVFKKNQNHLLERANTLIQFNTLVNAVLMISCSCFREF